MRLDPLDQRGPFVDQGRIKLNKRRAGFDLREGCFARFDAADTDQRDASAGCFIDLGEHDRRPFEQRTAGQSAGLTGDVRVQSRRPGERRIRDGDGINAVVLETFADGGEIFDGDVGCNLHGDRYPGFAFLNLAAAFGHNAAEEFITGGGGLEVAQAGCVRRRDVDHEVVGFVVEGFDAGDVVGGAVAAFFIGTHVDTHDAVAAAATYVRRDAEVAGVVEAKPVNECAITDQTKHAWSWIADLREGGNRADLGETETDIYHYVGDAAVLVEAGCDTDGVGEPSVPEVEAEAVGIRSGGTVEHAACKRAQRHLVGALRFHHQKHRPREAS